MAKLYPNKLSGKVAPHLLRVHRQLKQLPDSFSVWFNLAASDKDPQFLIIWEDRCAYLLYVTATKQELVDTAIHGNLFEKTPSITAESIGESMRDVLITFTQRLPNPASFPIKSVVVFPNVKKDRLDTISSQMKEGSQIQFLGKNQLSGSKIAQFFISNAPDPISEPQLVQLRSQFSPEISIPQHFTPLAIKRREVESLPQLLDFDQEWCMKNNLYLPEDAQLLAEKGSELDLSQKSVEDEPVRGQLVTGVAGSGKSLILLYRALINAQLNPDAKVLILTHNRPINNELRSRFDYLSQSKLNITWLTFFQWARRELGASEWSNNEKILYPEEAQKILEEITRDLPDNKLSPLFLLDEIGFLKDHYITDLEDYLAFSRIGRSRTLNKNQRMAVWEIFRKYQHYLKVNKLTDWHNIAIRFHQKVMTDQCCFPCYHCILIDEAQFFAKAWFEVVKKALIPGGQLFLAADPTQGFLKRRQSWISSGIEVRGRTTKLKKAYRNSREILQFATQFYLERQKISLERGEEIDEGLNLLSAKELQEAKSFGSKGVPVIVRTETHQDANAQLLHQLKILAEKRKEQTVHPSILIIHADSKQFFSMLASLQKNLPHLNFHDMKGRAASADTFAQVTTLNAATGLEASIVFLLGVDVLLGKEESPKLSQDEKSDLITQHTRLLYMAFTRAAQKLVVFSKNLPDLKWDESVLDYLEEAPKSKKKQPKWFKWLKKQPFN